MASLGSQGDLWCDAVSYLGEGSVSRTQKTDLVNVPTHTEATEEPEWRRPSVASADSEETLCEPDSLPFVKCPDNTKLGKAHTLYSSLGSVGQVWAQADKHLVAGSGCEMTIPGRWPAARGAVDDVVEIETFPEVAEDPSSKLSEPSLRPRVAGIKPGEEYKRHGVYKTVKFSTKAKRQGEVWEDFVQPGWEVDYGPPFRF
ncbi:hypothetical protein BDY19DRAFT_956082 [Irpex rosettiformis]|uniref:Uncharacterized protein n=1 Tax=Irpex rosettiformis TaxID=378272 RepID=A0ACB8TYN9_9APHY|nr:hypothetical protein BDY19DRAFT_956082 [Irpex rosettiformis]